MRILKLILYPGLLLILSGCVTKFMPEIDESRELLVVEGIITDQNETNTIRLTKSSPLDRKNTIKPVLKCIVNLSDDLGNTWLLKEKGNGYYVTDSTVFRGVLGRSYTLRVDTRNSLPNGYNYESDPVEMKPVPEIDRLYYERVLIAAETDEAPAKEGCEVLLDTRDSGEGCSYFRWDYTETWEISLPYDVTNKICWVTNNSSQILLKNTSHLSQNNISAYPVTFISNETDRLENRYSIFVRQYSISEQEYNYWSRMQTMSEQTGTLYDVMPSSVQGNMNCIEDPSEKVLGFFSVSAKKTKRIYVDELFSGLPALYKDCAVDTVGPTGKIPNLGVSLWIIIDGSYEIPPYRVLTDKKGCADCTVRGTTKKPAFWESEYKHQE
ncbi:MAG TPA: DUF4249 domain-containing protein [Bacteroidales bacterium]|nr:DUF4249 domain-containing protein [Bacteroidales bacterium]